MSEKTEAPESGVSDDMITAAKADLKIKNETRAEGLRTFKREGSVAEIKVLDLYEFPEEFDLDGLSPVSYLAQPEGEITGSVDTQTFSLRKERLKGLSFDVPSRRLERGRALRVVKALSPTGALVQIPFEGQVNNTAAGDLADAIGVKKYARKGFIIFYDFERMQSIYCMARNCWAAAMVSELAEVYPQHYGVIASGYCSYDHMAFIEPNLAKREGAGMFSVDATTTKSRGY